MAQIRVSTQELRNTANELEQCNEVFRTQAAGLRDDENLLSQSYEGDSQKQFHTAFMANAEKFDQFHMTVQNFIRQLREDADAYDRMEAENAAIASTK